MNKYCVYYHVDNCSNIRYVGSGTIYRANQLHAKSCRGKDYEEYVTNNGKLSTIVIHNNLSMTEARELELEEYTKIDKELLLNTSAPSKIKDMSLYDFNMYFYYDESSPTCIRRKYVNPHDNRNKIDEPAGYLHKSSGYFCVSIRNKSFQISRVVWILFNSSIRDGFVIDHINGIITDNRISNLRMVSIAENSRNKSKRREKRKVIVNGEILLDDLPTGITKRSGSNSLVARVSTLSLDTELEKPKLIQKNFNVKENTREGYMQALSMAIAWRNEQIEYLNLLGAGYLERHGT